MVKTMKSYPYKLKRKRGSLHLTVFCMKTGSYLRWGDATRIAVTGLIGLVVSKSSEDSFGTILLGVWIVGAMLLCVFALSKSDAVVPANFDQLNIRDDQAPLLLKSALRLTVDQSSIYYAVYKPYSIFGEQLSHISEEDASLLDRVMTTEDSLRQMYSYASNVPSFYSRRITTNDGLEQHRSRNTEQGEAYEEEEHRMLHAYALALLPLPTSTDPLVALLSNPEDEEADEELFPRTSYYYQPQNNPHLMKLKNWKLKALSVTILLVGITKALLNTFLFIYSSSVLGISVTDIACLIMVQLTSEAMVHFTIEKWFIHKLNLGLITMLAHITTISCAIVYSCLGPNSTATRPILILLQILQAIAFQSVWSSAVDQIHIIVWNQYERMKERSKVSALYNSFGSALGATIAGIVLQYDLNNYSFLFRASIVFSALSFVISWGWTSDD
ncbi:unnamed protein product [Rhizopus stolonifer]